MRTPPSLQPIGHSTQKRLVSGNECDDTVNVFAASKYDTIVYGTLGFLLGIALNVGIVMVSALDATSDTARSSRSLSAENNVIRQQLSACSLRISELEAHTDSLRTSGNALHARLHGRRVIAIAGTHVTLATERPSHQPSLPVSIVFRASTMRGPK